MLRLFLLILLVLAVAGGGLGVWWFGVRGEPIPYLEAKAEAAETAPEPVFVELDPLSIPVMEQGQVIDMVTLVVSVEMTGNSGRSAIAARAPKLRDAMLSELHGLYSLRFVRERKDGLDLVKRRLLKASRKVLGDRVRGIFVQAVDTQQS